MWPNSVGHLLWEQDHEGSNPFTQTNRSGYHIGDVWRTRCSVFSSHSLHHGQSVLALSKDSCDSSEDGEMTAVEKLKRTQKIAQAKFIVYVHRVGGNPRLYRVQTYINYSDIRAIAKKLEGKTKSAFMRKAKRFFCIAEEVR